MKSLFNLSFRYKLPLWGSVLIICSALAVAVSLMVRAYEEVKDDLLVSSAGLGRTLAVTLFPAMLHDDVWRAFEIINAPFKGVPDNRVKAEMIIVLDAQNRVYVSSNPRDVPMLADLPRLSVGHELLADRLDEIADSRNAHTLDLRGARHLYVTTPIADEEAWLGTLIIAHSRDAMLPRFWSAARGGMVAGLLVMAVLLPINWYWGWRMAVPLVELAARMEQLGRAEPQDLDSRLYAYGDELGRLFEVYQRTVLELRRKRALEREMVRSERLAAVGRLAAGMAHEINNPLGGMLTAIDTLKHHSGADERTLRTVALIERGLNQIKDTVGALLVEARLKSRHLTPQDVDDVRTLVMPQAHKKAVQLRWSNLLVDHVALPATLIRQTLINLLLNAVQAAAERGEVACETQTVQGELRLVVLNDGKLLTPEQMAHLFEPFSPLSEGGGGLGLWVTYQIVRQLGGQIRAERQDDRMCFTACIPVGDTA